MAFVAKTGGKAVADIRGMFILLYKQAGSISDISEASVEDLIKARLVAEAGADGDAWRSILTLKGSVTVGQDAPSVEKILVDQHDTPIGITTEPGDFNFECNLPSMAAKDLEELGINALTDVDDPIQSGKYLQGLSLNGELYDAAIMVQTRTNQTLFFPHAQISFTFSKEDKVFVIKCTGQVLAPESEKIACPVYVTSEKKATEVEASTL